MSVPALDMGEGLDRLGKLTGIGVRIRGRPFGRNGYWLPPDPDR